MTTATTTQTPLENKEQPLPESYKLAVKVTLQRASHANGLGMLSAEECAAMLPQIDKMSDWHFRILYPQIQPFFKELLPEVPCLF